jgi:hypothetical protein
MYNSNFESEMWELFGEAQNKFAENLIELPLFSAGGDFLLVDDEEPRTDQELKQ